MPNPNRQNKIFVELLKSKRQAAGLSLRQVGTLSGVDSAQIQRMEAGTRHGSRETILCLIIGMKLGIEEGNELLVAAKYAPLRNMAYLPPSAE